MGKLENGFEHLKCTNAHVLEEDDNYICVRFLWQHEFSYIPSKWETNIYLN
jgi:hypothetical protein